MKKIYYHYKEWEDYKNGMFKDKQFSEAWEADLTKINEEDNLEIELENPEKQTILIKKEAKP